METTGASTSSSELAVTVRAVTKIFGKGQGAVHALRGVDLDIYKGEVLYLTGPSGSGKTTLVSIIGCVLTATGGEVNVLGADVARLGQRGQASLRLDTIGFIFQGHNLIASLTALENVRLPLRMQGLSTEEASARAAETLGRVGLSDKLDKKPNELSGGQKQRVSIARALVTRPPLILADEPTASLDAKSGLEVMELMTGLARQDRCTVVVVTHDNRIYHFADRRVAIEDGRIVN